MTETPPHKTFFSWAASMIVFLVAALAVGALWLIRDVNISSGEGDLWMSEGTPEREQLERFNERFENKEVLLLSWENCLVNDPALARVAEAIRERDREEAAAQNRESFFSGAQTLKSLLGDIPSLLLSRSELEERVLGQLRGSFVGTDGETGVLSLECSAYGRSQREEAFRLAGEEARKILGEEVVLRFGGQTFLTICANKETRRTLVMVTPIVAAISLLTALILLRSFLLAFLAFSASSLAALFSIAAIRLAGHDLGDMIAAVPSLAQLLAMSNGVHLINYYCEDWLRNRSGEKAWRYSIRVGWIPTIAASVTTIIGFAALATSDLPVAKDFAVFGSVGICCAALVVLLVIPSVLALVRPGVHEPHRFQKRFVDLLMYLSGPQRITMSIVLTCVLAGGLFGLGRLQSEVRMETFFSKKSEFREHFDWMQERFSGPQSSELMITFQPESGLLREDQVSYLRELASGIRSLDERYAVFSPSLFAEALPTGDDAGLLDGANRVRFFESVWKNAQSSGWAHHDAEGDHWRISIQHPSEPSFGESEFLRGIGSFIDRKTSGVEIVLTGTSRVFAKSQDGLLRQLLRTFLLAFIVITPVVIVFLRCFKLGIIAILGNVFPLVVFFGAMGWVGSRIDIATMMIAAVAFGIAVDDTVHFLTWLGRGFRRHDTLKGSIRFAFENSAGAILQTTLIISISMMAFLLSDFRPSVRFATFSSIVLLIALVGDLIYLPALIRCSPSHIFVKGEQPSGTSDSSSAELEIKKTGDDPNREGDETNREPG